MEVLSLLSDDMETDNAGPGENLKLRLKGIEEEEILPGFILCNAENLCHSGRIFDAQVSVALHTCGLKLEVQRNLSKNKTTPFSFVFGYVDTIQFDQDLFIKVMPFLNNKAWQSFGLSHSSQSEMSHTV